MQSEGWHCRHWTPTLVAGKPKRQLQQDISDMRSAHDFSVLFFDDYGDALITSIGPWLDTMLFEHVMSRPDDGRGAFRFVAVTRPRDADIRVPGSSVRERLRAIPVAPAHECGILASDFGFPAGSQPKDCCGEGFGLLSTRISGAIDQRGIFSANAVQLAVQHAGELTARHDARLHRVLSTGSATWDPELDGFFKPLTMRVEGSPFDKVVPTDQRAGAKILPLLITSPWPADLVDAGRRFAARCGNEPLPLWTDPFLLAVEDTKIQDFIAAVRNSLPPTTTLRILCSDYVNDAPMTRADASARASWMAGDLAATGPQIEVRMVTTGADRTRLHRRGISLPRRRSFCTLPPVDRMLSIRSIGNEFDEYTHRSDNDAEAAWIRATRILETAP